MSNNIRNQPAYFPEGSPEDFNQPSMLYPGMLGSRLTQEAVVDSVKASRTYQIVGTDSSMSVAPYRGAIAWWSDKSRYLVTTSPTALGRGRVAGVFRTAVTLGNFCTVQTQGRAASVKIIDAPTAAPTVAGLIVTPSATAGKADVLAAGSPATYPALGVTASALAGADSTCTVDLDVPETP
jgi:hypothetical protein